MYHEPLIDAQHGGELSSDATDMYTPTTLSEALILIERLRRRRRRSFVYTAESKTSPPPAYAGYESLQSPMPSQSEVSLSPTSKMMSRTNHRNGAHAHSLNGNSNGAGVAAAYDDVDAYTDVEQETVKCGCLDAAFGESARATMDFSHYFKTPFTVLLMKRLPWLITLLLLQSFNAFILRLFEDTLAQNLTLTFFLSTIAGTQGNAGNQPSVMLTRALATGHVRVRAVLLKEGLLSILTAAVMSLVMFARVIGEYPDQLEVAAVLSVTLFFGIILSISLGVIFAVGLDRIRSCDPADGATPLLTTVSDMMGVTVLCGVAVVILGTDVTSD